MFAVEYPTCGDAGVERAVEEAVEEAMRAPEPIGPDLDRARVSVAFFHEERRRALFGLTVHVDRVYWERWTVSVVMRSSRRTEAEDALDRERRQVLLDDAVRGAVVEIATLATREPDRMPPHDFASSSAIPFPYIVRSRRARGGHGPLVRKPFIPPVSSLLSLFPLFHCRRSRLPRSGRSPQTRGSRSW